MKLAVIDDELPALRLLEEYVSELSTVSEARYYSDAHLALKELVARPVDVIFLDINMPDLDGMSFAEKMKDWSHPPKIIFLTAHANYALEAFEMYAFDFLLKPLSLDRFEESIERFLKSQKRNNIS